MNMFYGTGVALVTPFTATGEIDFQALKRLLKHTAKGGVDYYVVMGTTGESPTVSFQEKLQILKFVKDNNPKGLPIVFGIGGNNTQSILEGIRQTDFEGLSGILSVSPYYNKPSQEGIYQHFKSIASKCPVPVILYNVPGRTSSNMTAETTIRLSKLKNIAGIKEASGNIEQCMKIVQDAAEGFILVSGDDMITVPLYSIGSKGVISVLANAMPDTFRKMKEYSFANKFEKARIEQFKIIGINGAMYEEGNPVGIKQFLSEMGIIEPHCRLPMVEASPALKKKISTFYKSLKK